MKQNTIITISRQYGSGGKEIGRKLAALMNIPFYDSEFISMAASTETGIKEEFIKNIEHNVNDRMMFPLSFLNPAMDSYSNSTNEEIFLVQSKIIQMLAEKGPCVIVGRGADFILSDRKDVVNIFIAAPMEERVRRAVDEYSIDSKAAQKYVHGYDHQRESYYNYFTGRTWGDPQNFDIIINSYKTGIDNSIKLIKFYIDML